MIDTSVLPSKTLSRTSSSPRPPAPLHLGPTEAWGGPSFWHGVPCLLGPGGSPNCVPAVPQNKQRLTVPSDR